MNRSCLLINSSPRDQKIFVEALASVAPDTFFMLAIDSTEAFDILLDDGLIPDCVFVELTMPGIDAEEFLRKAKSNETLKDVPVIVHSPIPVRHRIEELLGMGAHALYFKPYNYFGVCNVLNLYFKDFAITVN